MTTEWSELGYRDAHRRLRRKRGRAKEETCVECGQQAAQWALRHDEPPPQSGWIQLPGRSRRYWLEWSSDPEDYDAMCRPCHRKRDAAHKPRQMEPLCPRGHVRSKEYVTGSNGNGYCRACLREAARKGGDVPCTECEAHFATARAVKCHAVQMHKVPS